MSETTENAATRLWRDRAHLREQERDEALAKARIAEEKVTILTAENDRLAAEIARLRALLAPDAARCGARPRGDRAADGGPQGRAALVARSTNREQPSLTSRLVQRGMLKMICEESRA